MCYVSGVKSLPNNKQAGVPMDLLFRYYTMLMPLASNEYIDEIVNDVWYDDEKYLDVLTEMLATNTETYA